jgi:hypothetical protein
MRRRRSLNVAHLVCRPLILFSSIMRILTPLETLSITAF